MKSIPVPQSRCRFGIARADITPPVGIYHRMWGAARHDRAESIHRPLFATVAIFANLETAADIASDVDLQVVVALDHCVMAQQELDNLRNAIRQQIDVPPASILVVFSHTHAAGLMSLDRRDLPGGDLIPDYLESMNQAVAQAAASAYRSLSPATIVYGQGRCLLANNRDFWDEESQQYVCGFNPREAGDEMLLVARVQGDAGNCLATIVNYACHPTTLSWDNTAVSPDYPGAMREVVETATEDGAICLFLQGAAGDLGPVEGFVGDVDVAERNGRQLGYAALSALTALPKPGTVYQYDGPVVSGATIGTWKYVALEEAELQAQAAWHVRRATLDMPYRPELPTLADTESALARLTDEEEGHRAAGELQKAADCRALAERQRRMSSRLAMLPSRDAFPLQVMVAHWGGAYWVAVQGEPYNEFQRQLRSRFHKSPVIVMTLANEWGASYLPADDDYDKPLYQVDVAVLARGCLESLTEKVIEALESL